MAAEATQTLAQFARALRYEDLPQRVRDHCKNLLLDALACAVAGRLGEETGQVAAFASALAQSSEASVIGGEPLSLAGATLLNAYLVTAVDHVRRASRDHDACHARSGAAGARHRRARWRSTAAHCSLRIAAGCEVTTRVGLGTRLSEIPRPRLAWPRHFRSVRRGCGGRLAARVSMPTPWRGHLVWPAARPPAPSPPGARRR